MVKSLVIGYGNSLRSDDGIGVRVAEIVADWYLPEVRSLCLPQLTPELAADLAKVDLVIFVDACQTLDSDTVKFALPRASFGGAVSCCTLWSLSAPSDVGSLVKLHSLKPLDSSELRSHFSDPRAILSLTQAIYRKCPQAWWIIVPGVNFQFGECLSSVAEKGVSQALIQIKNLISEKSPDRNICTK